ncbi:MAG: polysaccharide pyruvyl transferase CsaB [Bacillota bacterium]
MTKKIVISGYYGFDNLGDEAILYSIINLFKEKNADIEITVLSQSPAVTSQRYGVKSIQRNNFVKIIKTLKKSDVFLSGGGSLLQDVSSFRSVFYYLALVFLANIMGNKTIFYAQGIGPLNKKISRKLLKWIGNSTDLITVRDHNSAQLLKEIGIRADLIEETVDPVYGMNSARIRELTTDQKNNKLIADFLKNTEIDRSKNIIGVSPRFWGDNEYLENMARAADYLQEKSEARIIILPMHLEEDLEVCQKLKDEMKRPAAIFKRQLEPAAMISFFQTFDFFLGVRLHSLIFAAINEVPFVGISYDPKVDSLLKELNLETSLTTENCNYKDLKKVIDKFWNKRDEISSELGVKMKNYRKKAEKNAERVLNLI